MENNYRKIYASMSSAQLLDVYNNNRGKYEDEVYDVVESLLKERNINFAKIEVNDEDDLNDTHTVTYAPMVLGIISILITIFGQRFSPILGDLINSLVLMFVIRVIFLAYANDLCKKYQLNKTLWLLLVFIFGGWAMIALNIAMLMKTNTEDLKQEDAEVNNSNASNDFDMIVEQETVTVLTNCPACLKDLAGKKQCTDCDLDFG